VPRAYAGMQTDPGRSYPFTSAEKLINDFFSEVERVLTERGVPLDVIADDDEE